MRARTHNTHTHTYTHTHEDMEDTVYQETIYNSVCVCVCAYSPPPLPKHTGEHGGQC
jgi:hypothetical protein